MKRYFVTNKLESQLPYSFVHARGKRHISLVSCDFIEKIDDGETIVVRTPMHISMHSNIVQADRHHDSFIDFVNRVRDKRPKFEQLYPEETLRIWFKNINDLPLDYPSCEFVVKVLLEWNEEK